MTNYPKQVRCSSYTHWRVKCLAAAYKKESGRIVDEAIKLLESREGELISLKNKIEHYIKLAEIVKEKGTAYEEEYVWITQLIAELQDIYDVFEDSQEIMYDK